MHGDRIDWKCASNLTEITKLALGFGINLRLTTAGVKPIFGLSPADSPSFMLVASIQRKEKKKHVQIKIYMKMYNELSTMCVLQSLWRTVNARQVVVLLNYKHDQFECISIPFRVFHQLIEENFFFYFEWSNFCLELKKTERRMKHISNVFSQFHHISLKLAMKKQRNA